MKGFSSIRHNGIEYSGDDVDILVQKLNDNQCQVHFMSLDNTNPTYKCTICFADGGDVTGCGDSVFRAIADAVGYIYAMAVVAAVRGDK